MSVLITLDNFSKLALLDFNTLHTCLVLFFHSNPDCDRFSNFLTTYPNCLKYHVGSASN